MDALNKIIESFKTVIEQIVDFFKDFIKQMRAIGDENGKKDDADE